jgi:uncharacterized membrane protein
MGIAIALASVLRATAGDTVPPCLHEPAPAGDGHDCGPLDFARELLPQAINNLGHWAGYRHRCDAEVISDVFGRLALKWTPETGVQQLPLPPQTHDARALGINDSGVVVGWRAGESLTDSRLGYWGCVWTAQGLVEIPHHEPLGNSSFAYAINNSGVVVGYRDSGEEPVLTYGFVWIAGTIIDIDPAPFGGTEAFAHDVSDAGFVVGHLSTSTSPNAKAFIWKDGVTQLLAPVDAAVASRAYGVNDIGQAVGSCRIPQAEYPGFTNQPTMWEADGTPRLLTILPPYTGATLHSINNAGVVLGLMSMPPNPDYPYLRYAVWIDDVPYWVSDLADSPNASSFGGVNVDLNQRGQLVVEGPSSIMSGAWILTPQSSAADLNGDCRVDGLDLAALLDTWGPCSAAEHADFDRSGIVDGADLGALLGAWSVE